MENNELHQELLDRIDAIKSQIKQLQETQQHIEEIINIKFPVLIGSTGEVPPTESEK